MPQAPDKATPDLDRFAMLLSALCLVHCLALPVALAALPFMGAFGDGHWHLPMLAIALPVSVLAIVIGYRRHGNMLLVLGVVAGLCLLVTGATVGHALNSIVIDRGLTVAGSLLLAVVHWHNSRQLRRCNLRRTAYAGS